MHSDNLLQWRDEYKWGPPDATTDKAKKDYDDEKNKHPIYEGRLNAYNTIEGMCYFRVI